ncbi:MAG: flagellar hook-associated protein FlgL, partial [Pseudomonadota bacterium]
MRVGTWTMYQNYTVEQQSSFSRINNTYNQISTGKNIEYGYQDINIQTNTLRLNDQLSSLDLNKNASWAGREYGFNTDTAMSGMVQSLTAVKTNLVKASNQTNSPASLSAIAQELKGLKSTLMTLANSSLNGQYLFSGTATTTQAVSSDGTYQGNAGKMKATVSAGMSLAYNIDGKGLFLGQDSDYARTVSTNVPQFNKPAAYLLPPVTSYITTSSAIGDLTGNPGDGSQTSFYVSGTNSSGASFKQAFTMSTTSPVSDLLSKVKSMYSNDVDVSLNEHGEIQVKDLLNGSSKLDFRMVASSNSVSLTKATAGLTAGATSMTVASATGIQAGDVLNIEKVGQVTVSSVAGTTVNFVGTPLTKGLPSDMSTTNVTKSVLPTADTTTANTIAAGSTSPQTIAVASTNGAVVGGTLALVDATGNSISGKITALSGTNVTFSFSGTSPAAAITTPTVKFTTPANLTQATTLGAAAAAGASSITVNSSQGISVGGSITLGGSSGSQTLKVTGINSATGAITLQNPPG